MDFCEYRISLSNIKKENVMFGKSNLMVFVCLLFVGNIVSGMDDNAVNVLLAKIKKADDPEGVKATIKTQIQKVETIFSGQKISTITIDKFPNKTRIDVNMPGVMTSTTCYNGKTAWEISPATGVREIKGKELDSIKLDMVRRIPSVNQRDVFEKIVVADKLETIGEFKCYKMTCTPKKEFNSTTPIVLYYDKEKLLLRKMNIVVDSKMGPMKMELTLEDYKKVNKMWVSMLSTIDQMGMKLKVKVLEYKINVKVDDSIFEKPKSK